MMASSQGKAHLVALAVPVGALGGALAFQYFGGLYPCEMCWWQRYAHMAALLLAVVAIVLPGARRLFIGLAGLALVAAAVVSAYHAGVEYGWWKGLTACTSDIDFAAGGDPLKAILDSPVVRCDVVQWKLFGISLAGYDFLISGLAALAVFALLARSTKEQN
ncbi:MAG TPA: disulfide bond formation protein B [Novosphingobium sp.]|nr:disulfide bond formation protein B [Novosphingobium sp.]